MRLRTNVDAQPLPLPECDLHMPWTCSAVVEVLSEGLLLLHW